MTKGPKIKEIKKMNCEPHKLVTLNIYNTFYRLIILLKINKKVPKFHFFFEDGDY